MYLTEWLEIHKSQVKPKTAHRYEQIARDYVFPHLGKIKLPEINVFTVEELYQTLLHDGVSIRNVRYVHSLLHRSLIDALKRGLVAANAAQGARQPKLQQKEMAIWDEYQVRQFLNAAHSHRYLALFHMAVKTGMRQGELLGLKWTDIDWMKGQIKVQRQVQYV